MLKNFHNEEEEWITTSSTSARDDWLPCTTLLSRALSSISRHWLCSIRSRTLARMIFMSRSSILSSPSTTTTLLSLLLPTALQRRTFLAVLSATSLSRRFERSWTSFSISRRSHTHRMITDGDAVIKVVKKFDLEWELESFFEEHALAFLKKWANTGLFLFIFVRFTWRRRIHWATAAPCFAVSPLLTFLKSCTRIRTHDLLILSLVPWPVADKATALWYRIYEEI